MAIATDSEGTLGKVMIHEENDDDFHQGNGREFQTFPYSTISISNRDEKEGLLVWESQKYATPDNASIVISAAGPDFIPEGIISFAQRHKSSDGLTLHRCTQQRVPRQQQAHKCDQETNLEVVKTFLGPGDPVETSLCPYASLAHPWGDRITSRDCVSRYRIPPWDRQQLAESKPQQLQHMVGAPFGIIQSRYLNEAKRVKT
ncbi:predicted protein [Histoplasma mississippiense (nom. inval.)]|uniref:predicted protein n=1 Tax=Ajellomyces capsulatus (strain NAm1 / WU24) TaxID=2059318 RepID=UPI000157C641|nr:predicted protein [Histoplasma mississippiense (nom. inval.)]EDN08806.1 predicted protein [Histoplasma mississippiense (nom. inval.)]